MNTGAFLNRVAEVYKPNRENAIKIFYHGGNVILDINGHRWHDATLDLCVQQVKQSFAIQYLQDKEFEQGKATPL